MHRDLFTEQTDTIEVSVHGVKFMAILRIDEVTRRTGLSKATIYALIKQGRFPRPRLLGKRGVGWIEEEIEEWIRSRPVTPAA